MSAIVPILPWVQVALSLVIIILILFQRSDGDLGAAFGGSGNAGATHTKRGLERSIFISTIVLVIIFAVLAILAVVVNI